MEQCKVLSFYQEKLFNKKNYGQLLDVTALFWILLLLSLNKFLCYSIYIPCLLGWEVRLREAIFFFKRSKYGHCPNWLNPPLYFGHFPKSKIDSESSFLIKYYIITILIFFPEWFKQHLKILFSQLLEGQSEFLKGQNGEEFNFQSICKHHRSLRREKGGLFAFLAHFLTYKKLK